MEILFEIIFEIIVDGALEAVSSRKVPMPLRILAALIVVGVFGGVIFLIVFTGIICLRSKDNIIAVAIILFLIAAMVAGVLIWRVVKFYKNRFNDISRERGEDD